MIHIAYIDLQGPTDQPGLFLHNINKGMFLSCTTHTVHKAGVPTSILDSHKIYLVACPRQT